MVKYYYYKIIKHNLITERDINYAKDSLL